MLTHNFLSGFCQINQLKIKLLLNSHVQYTGGFQQILTVKLNPLKGRNHLKKEEKSNIKKRDVVIFREVPGNYDLIFWVVLCLAQLFYSSSIIERKW